ncbi:MAG: glycosyltransferase, partial [Bacteroidales bacterium]|nr:glycosyltransferase [Bacteroidales bacterium]
MMNTIPTVSILVITYNQEAYIGKALDSLLMQECPFDYEILVGEDCSTDGTRNICLEYAKNNPDKIRLFLNEKNKG